MRCGACTALARVVANVGHVRAYGDDPWTDRFEARVREHFGDKARAFCVFGGTAANVLGLQTLLERHESVWDGRDPKKYADGFRSTAHGCTSAAHYRGTSSGCQGEGWTR